MVDSVSSTSSAAGYGVENLIRAGNRSSAQQVVRAAAASLGAVTRSELTPEQQRQVEELKSTDAKVHRHEQAHLAVGRELIRGGPSYTYTTGPDKRRYAVAGEVSIDTTPAKTPEETIPKAQHIQATALAPADPSPQDHSVAAEAARMEAEARAEVQLQQRAAAVQSSSDFYGGVEQAGSGGGPGSTLDLFA